MINCLVCKLRKTPVSKVKSDRFSDLFICGVCGERYFTENLSQQQADTLIYELEQELLREEDVKKLSVYLNEIASLKMYKLLKERNEKEVSDLY